MNDRTDTREGCAFGCHHARAGHERAAPPPACPGAGLTGKLFWGWRWFWFMLVRNRLVIAVASVIWLIWRSGTQPRRLAYPCQQAAAANLGVFAVVVIPALARRRKARRGSAVPPVVQLATGSVALAGVLFVLISAGAAVWSDLVKIGFTPGHPAMMAWPLADVSQEAGLTPRVFAPSGSEAVVAVNRNLSVRYGQQPYGPGPDSAYDLIWQTVADLHLGPPNNPLADLIEPGDKVLIKPNTVWFYAGAGDENENRSPVYSHPATIRPLVDMAALAGASEILVGDGSDGDGDLFTDKFDRMGYTQSYFNQLSALWPGVTIARVDFQNLSYWSWVNLHAEAGGASAYADSGYASTDLVKTHENAAYFSQADPHGRPGPTESACMGWLALTDYVLNADVVIDLAKLKVHYYGVSTAVLKNWVGITTFSTYNMSEQGWCRISHELYEPTLYQKGFGNDIMWRELVDAHRAALYWKRNQDPSTGGTLQSVPQRKYLCILDAINCAEKYHVRGGDVDIPWHYWLYTVLASVDPVAIDAVGARLQRYRANYEYLPPPDDQTIAPGGIPIINNANVPSNRPIGTGDPGEVRVVGSTRIDSSYAHVFEFETNYDPTQSWPDWNGLVINDLYPPTINSAGAQNLGGGTWQVQADISNAYVAFYYYGDDGSGAPQVVRLGRNGDTFSATIQDVAGNGTVAAQDKYFNTATARVATMPEIGLSTGEIDPVIHVGENADDDTFTVANTGIGTLDYTVVVDQPWLDVDPEDGLSTGEQDTITVSYACSSLSPGTYAATITVSDPNASNDPQAITVTVEVQTVSCDFAPADGDVDQEDFGHFQMCLTGPGSQAVGACEDADLDGDRDVDSGDFSILQRCLSGANVLANKTCDDLP